MALFGGIQEYIALDANNITIVFDSGNIVNISGNIFLYPPRGHPILYNNPVKIKNRKRIFLKSALYERNCKLGVFIRRAHDIIEILSQKKTFFCMGLQ